MPDDTAPIEPAQTPQPLEENEAPPKSGREPVKPAGKKKTSAAHKKSSRKKSAAKKNGKAAPHKPNALDDVDAATHNAARQQVRSLQEYESTRGDRPAVASRDLGSGRGSLIDEDDGRPEREAPRRKLDPQAQDGWGERMADHSPPPRPDPTRVGRGHRELDPEVSRSTVREGSAVHNVSRVVDPRADSTGDRPSNAPTGDPLNDRLGVRGCAQYQTFDWAKDRRGFHLEFSRWYRALRLIVDFFPRPSADVERDVLDKHDAITAHNEKRPTQKIGYIGLYLGQEPTDETLNLALDDAEFFAPPVVYPVGMRPQRVAV